MKRTVLIKRPQVKRSNSGNAVDCNDGKHDNISNNNTGEVDVLPKNKPSDFLLKWSHVIFNKRTAA